MIAEDRALARRRLVRIALVYALATTALIVVNVRTHGPAWWYWASGGLALALVMHAIQLWR